MVCASNIIRDVAFYSGGGDVSSFMGLNVYLDSPMVFSLLGADEYQRIEAMKLLIKKLQDAGCNILIFNHTFAEVDGIFSRAAGWAVTAEYKIDKANNVARFLHNEISDPELISEYCTQIETKLNELGISIFEAEYDVNTTEFQEDEKQLYNMILERHLQTGYLVTDERKCSIAIDVRKCY